MTLVDVSRADAKSIQLGAITLKPESQVPVPYQISYDSGMVDARGQYAVQAIIRVDDEVLWRTTSVFPALTRDAPEQVDVMVQKMERQVSESDSVPFANTEWSVVTIDGKSLPTKREATLSFDDTGRAGGTSGCNRFNGAVDNKEGGLSFGLMAVTQMACPADMGAQEKAFFAALGRVQGFSMGAEVLDLLDVDGNTVMQLVQK